MHDTIRTAFYRPEHSSIARQGVQSHIAPAHRDTIDCAQPPGGLLYSPIGQLKVSFMTRDISLAFVVLAIAAAATAAEKKLPARMRPMTNNAVGAASLTNYSVPTGLSPTCGTVTGKTQKDLDNVLAFCAAGIMKGAVVGADAMDSLLWLKLSRAMADGIRADKLSGQQLITVWMRGWKTYSGSKAVTVSVLWMDVEIAEGQTTMLRGDQVTIR